MPPVGFEPTISAGERPAALCDELITRPEESYRLCCVVVCDLETSRIGAPYTYDISSLRVKSCSKQARTQNFSPGARADREVTYNLCLILKTV